MSGSRYTGYSPGTAWHNHTGQMTNREWMAAHGANPSHYKAQAIGTSGYSYGTAAKQNKNLQNYTGRSWTTQFTPGGLLGRGGRKSRKNKSRRNKSRRHRNKSRRH